MRFIIAALALMAMFSTASAQMDQFMTMQLLKNMQQQNKNPGAGGTGGGHGFGNNMAAMMAGDMMPEMSDIMMNNYLMNQMKGHNSGAAGASGGGFMGMGGMGMNPFMAGMDASDLALWSLMNRNNNQPTAKHNRAQMYPGMGGGFQNPLASAMMFDTMTGNDFLGMEGLGAMALMGGMSPMMGAAGMSPMMGMGMPSMMGSTYPGYNYGAHAAAPAQYAYPQQPKKYYAPHAASPRGAAHQFMPGMGMSPMGGMGMGNPMGNMMMMDAMSGGDLMGTDLASDYGNMMMMQNMMRPKMPMMGYNPYQQHVAYPNYYPAQPVSAQPVAPSASNSGFGSRIKDKFAGGKRGGMYDNLWEMNLIQSLLNPNSGAGAGTGAGAGASPLVMDPASLAAAEMALGDVLQNPAQQTESAAQDQPAVATDVAGTGTSSDPVVPQ